VADVFLEVFLWSSLPIIPGLYNKYTLTLTHIETMRKPLQDPLKSPGKLKWAHNVKDKNCSFSEMFS